MEGLGVDEVNARWPENYQCVAMLSALALLLFITAESMIGRGPK